MIKETCKECGMTIQAGSNEDAASLKSSMEKHVEDEHANPIAKHKQLLDDCGTFIQNFLTNARKNTKKNAKALAMRINEFTKDIDVDSLPTDAELEEMEPVKTVAPKKQDAANDKSK